MPFGKTWLPGTGKVTMMSISDAFNEKVSVVALKFFFRSVEKQLKEQCDDGQAYCWMSCLDGLTNHISIASMIIISIFIIEKFAVSSSKLTKRHNFDHLTFSSSRV